MAPYSQDTEKQDIIRKMTSSFAHLESERVELLVKLDKFKDAWIKAKEKHLQNWNISEGRFMVIMAIWHSGGKIKAADIAHELGVSRATMTGLVDSLLRDDYIVKADCELDRRVCYLSLSDKGQTFVKTMLPDHMHCIKEFTDAVTLEEAREFTRILDKLQKSLKTFIETECESAKKLNP